MLVSSSAAQLRETIVKRVALEFKNGMYGILFSYLSFFFFFNYTFNQIRIKCQYTRRNRRKQ